MEHAVLEQHGALARLTLVIEVVGPPTVRDRRIVNPIDDLARTPGPDEPSVDARLLVHSVRLERMPDRLVEENTTHPGCEDHRHLTGRRGDGVEHRHGTLGRLLADRLRAESVEELDARARGGAEEPGLDRPVARGDDLGHESDPRTVLLDPAAVGGRDQPLLEGIAVHPDDLQDLGTHASSGVIELTEPGNLVGRGELTGRPVRPVHPSPMTHGKVDDRAGLTFLQRGARRLGGLEERVTVEAVRERIAVGGAERDADTRPAIEPAGQLLDVAVVQMDRRRGSLLDEELGEGSPATSGSLQDLLDELAGQHGRDANSGPRTLRRTRRRP